MNMPSALDGIVAQLTKRGLPAEYAERRGRIGRSLRRPGDRTTGGWTRRTSGRGCGSAPPGRFADARTEDSSRIPASLLVWPLALVDVFTGTGLYACRSLAHVRPGHERDGKCRRMVRSG